MQLLGNARAFAQPLFEPDVEFLRQAAQPHSIDRDRRHGEEDDNRRTERPRLPERWNDFHADGRLGTIPDPLTVAGNHAEPVGAGRQIHVDRVARRRGIAPGLIQIIQPVAVFHSLRRG